MKITEEESAAIAALKKVSESWPKSLWLFSASGRLKVMKKDGRITVMTEGGGYDQRFVVDEIDIENDGGDW